MKIKFLMTALLAFAAISAFAQKGELSNANEQYGKYDVARQNYTLAKPFLMNAKTSIDKASANQKTAALPETYALKAAVYASLAFRDTVSATSATEYATAVEALNKAKELDTKKENTNLIQHATGELAQLQLDRGVKAYQSKKYDEAYKSFDAARQLVPEDTTAILYTAVSALNTKNYTATIANYNKLLTTNYKDKIKIYTDLPTIYLVNKDTAGAVKAATEGVTKFPNDAALRKEQIEIALQAGAQGDLTTKIDEAIKGDPNNKSLYYYAGLTHSQIAEAKNTQVKKLLRAAQKASQQAKPGTKPAAEDPQIAKLQTSMNEDYAKAADMYKKALAIDPNYFEAVLNLGYVSEAPAINIYNAAQLLPVTQVKAYNDAMAKANAQFDIAKPYVLKAVELNPNSLDALTNLRSFYLGKKDEVNANAIQKKIDALPKSN